MMKMQSSIQEKDKEIETCPECGEEKSLDIFPLEDNTVDVPKVALVRWSCGHVELVAW